MLSGEFFRRMAEQIEAQRRAGGHRPLRDCDFCERRQVRCVALDHRMIAREDLRGEVQVEPAWICIDCIRARIESA